MTFFFSIQLRPNSSPFIQNYFIIIILMRTTVSTCQLTFLCFKFISRLEKCFKAYKYEFQQISAQRNFCQVHTRFSFVKLNGLSRIKIFHVLWLRISFAARQRISVGLVYAHCYNTQKRRNVRARDCINHTHITHIRIEFISQCSSVSCHLLCRLYKCSYGCYTFIRIVLSMLKINTHKHTHVVCSRLSRTSIFVHFRFFSRSHTLKRARTHTRDPISYT